jgi:hypothetical protein
LAKQVFVHRSGCEATAELVTPPGCGADGPDECGELEPPEEWAALAGPIAWSTSALAPNAPPTMTRMAAEPATMPITELRGRRRRGGGGGSGA